jgi:hypothetical protein
LAVGGEAGTFSVALPDFPPAASARLSADEEPAEGSGEGSGADGAGGMGAVGYGTSGG